MRVAAPQIVVRPSDPPHGAAITRRVDVVDTHGIASADSHAGFPILAVQRAKQLHELSVKLQRDESIPLRVEAGRRACLVADAGFQR